MNEGIITSRYAKSLFQVSEEDGKMEAIYQDVQSLLLIIKESEEFREFLVSPIIKGSVKEKLFNEIFSKNVNSLTLDFLQLLTKNKREQHLHSVCLNFLQLYKNNKGIKEALITTAHPLDSQHKEEVNNFIKKKFKIDVELIEAIDESLIGGFKLRIENMQLDASIASKLKEIKTELINS